MLVSIKILIVLSRAPAFVREQYLLIARQKYYYCKPLQYWSTVHFFAGFSPVIIVMLYCGHDCYFSRPIVRRPCDDHYRTDLIFSELFTSVSCSLQPQMTSSPSTYLPIQSFQLRVHVYTSGTLLRDVLFNNITQQNEQRNTRTYIIIWFSDVTQLRVNKFKMKLNSCFSSFMSSRIM